MPDEVVKLLATMQTPVVEGAVACEVPVREMCPDTVAIVESRASSAGFVAALVPFAVKLMQLKGAPALVFEIAALMNIRHSAVRLREVAAVQATALLTVMEPTSAAPEAVDIVTLQGLSRSVVRVVVLMTFEDPDAV